MKQHGSLHVYCFVVIQKRRSFLQSAAKLGLLLQYFLFSKHTGQPKGQNGVRLDEHGVRLEWEGRENQGRAGTLKEHCCYLQRWLIIHTWVHVPPVHRFTSLGPVSAPLPAHFSLNILHDSGSFLLLGPFPKCTYDSMHHSFFISFSNTFLCCWKFDNRKQDMVR